MTTPYRYAVADNISKTTVRVTRLDYGIRTTKTGIVEKIGPYQFRAIRHFGGHLAKIFDTSDHGALCIDEPALYHAALQWACGGFDYLAPRF